MKVENVIIKRVSDVNSGTSVSTGNEWANRDILLEHEDETGKSYMNAVVDESIWQDLNLHKGDRANLTLRIHTKPFKNGFISNEIRIIASQN